MTLQEWIAAAPSEVKGWLQSVAVLNFLSEQRRKSFQMIGRYDGAMSKECTELCRQDYEVVNGLHAAIVGSLAKRTEEVCETRP